MNVSFRIAFRYLFSKKSHNTINVISIISACGVCIGTIALVCVLSVYNGFESLVKKLISEFDPDLKITLVEGKSFDITTDAMLKIQSIDGVAVFSPTIEEKALLKYSDKQVPVVIKGVSEKFADVTNIDNIVENGTFRIKDENSFYAVAGIGLISQLNTSINYLEPLIIYAPKRTARINLSRPETGFNQEYIFLSGIFSVKQASYDDNYLIVPIELAQKIYEYTPNIATAVELKLNPDANINKVQKEIRKLLGDGFHVKNHYEQQEDFFRMTRGEKWISYLILSFILLIAIFNIIGSLSMLIIEKEHDIAILRNLGATNKQIRHIFLYEGWLISILGAFIGIVIGVTLCLLQQHFGFIKLGGGNFIIEAYPVETQLTDILVIFVTVVALGFFAVRYPIKYLKAIPFHQND